ncbi:MAG: TIR domain-containing protein [Anaerolineales bacterium]|nr:TIR domain-containing protein [Anaerolineales bacterium]
MTRRVFFSFHYQRDVWRVNQIRNLPEIIGTSAAGFQDASLWEKAKKESDAAIKRMIDNALDGTSVTVVCVGNQTANREYVDYEITKSLERGNGLVAVQIHHLKAQNGQVDSPGVIPWKITHNGFKAYKYVDSDYLSKWIEEAAKIAGK